MARCTQRVVVIIVVVVVVVFVFLFMVVVGSRSKLLSVYDCL